MDLTQLANLGEFVGGIAVVASLLFVGLQIRANTKTQQAASGTRIQQSWADLNLRMADSPAATAFARATEPDASLSDFSEDEIVRISLTGRAIVQNFEAEFYQFQAGLLSSEVWEQHRHWCNSFLQLPAVSEWWAMELRQPVCSASFIQEIAEATESVPVGPAAFTSALRSARDKGNH